MVHNKTIFTITEIILPQQGMVYQGITIVHERLEEEEKKLKTNQKSETWKEIWNFHFVLHFHERESSFLLLAWFSLVNAGLNLCYDWLL